MSKLKECPSCAKEVSKSAKVCPGCGKKLKMGMFLKLVISVVVIVVAFVALGPSQEEKANSANAVLDHISTGIPSNHTSSGELDDIFSYNSDHTDLQRDNKEKEIKGSLVDWSLNVYEVSKRSDNKYRIQTSGRNQVGTFLSITTRPKEEVNYVESLKTKDVIHVRGLITGTTMRNINIEPAILVK
jgi:hypothetical protein